jgi:hypothetical protein
LDGRKPPIRLLARARHRDGRSLSMRAAVSESFVVVTQRQKCDLKADIPSVDDPVAVLVHMGAKTVKKLQDLRSAAHKVDARPRKRAATRMRQAGIVCFYVSSCTLDDTRAAPPR